jgi:hypothetical protein
MLVASLAEVSMKNIFSLAATFFPSSTLTHRCNMKRNRADETTIECRRCAGLVREDVTYVFAQVELIAYERDNNVLSAVLVDLLCGEDARIAVRSWFALGVQAMRLVGAYLKPFGNRVQ